MSIFNRTKRKIVPLAYYLDYDGDEENKENDIDMKLANPDDFPEAYFDKMILMVRRLHQMGVYEEEEIVRYNIPKVVELLEESDLLSNISITAFDTAGVVFGEKYAGWIYRGENKKGKDLYYKVPFQLLFYHSRKKDNYFICKTRDGMDLKQNEVSISNKEDRELNIRNTKCMNLNEKDMEELKLTYNILFMYIKIQILLKTDKFGYTDFSEKIGALFISEAEREAFISYAKQYFSLSMDMEEFYLAYESDTFKDFLYELLGRDFYAEDLDASYDDILKWAEERTETSIKIKNKYSDRFEFLKEISGIIARKGYYLYFLIKEERLWGTHLLLSKDSNIQERDSRFSYEIISFKDVAERYADDLCNESKIRGIAKEFYRIIGVEDVEDMMMKIKGDRVLDFELLKRGYLSAVLMEVDEDIYYILGKILERYGLRDLIEETSSNGIVLDEKIFSEQEGVNPEDRARLYADLIRQRGKALYSLEAGDYLYFGIIENNVQTKGKFKGIMEKLLNEGEIEYYTVFDSSYPE